MRVQLLPVVLGLVSASAAVTPVASASNERARATHATQRAHDVRSASATRSAALGRTPRATRSPRRSSVHPTRRTPRARSRAAEQGAPVYLNHAYTTVDAATYQALQSHPFFSEQFARSFARRTIKSDGGGYAAVYFQGGDPLKSEVQAGLASGKLHWADVHAMGEAAMDPDASGARTYFEAFEAGAARFPIPAGMLGIATSDETAGALEKLQGRLAANYDGKVEIEHRQTRAFRGDGSLQGTTAFTITSPAGPYGSDDSRLSVWHQTYPTHATEARPTTRAEFLRGLNGQARLPRMMKDITLVKAVAPASDVRDFATHMRAMGLHVRRAPGGAVVVRTPVDGSTSRYVVMTPTRDGRTGIEHVQFSLHGPAEHAVHAIGGATLTVADGHPTRATLTLPLSAPPASTAP